MPCCCSTRVRCATKTGLYALTGKDANKRWFTRGIDRMLHTILGANWQNVGKEQPTGTEITNAALSEALRSKRHFTQTEFAKFRVEGMRANSYVKSGDDYFVVTDASRALHASHAAFTLLKLVIFVIFILWIATRYARTRIHKTLDTILSITVGVFIILAASMTMFRLRSYAMTPLWTGLDVTVLSHWELSFVWWFMLLLVIVTICALVPSLHKYIFFFF